MMGLMLVYFLISLILFIVLVVALIDSGIGETCTNIYKSYNKKADFAPLVLYWIFPIIGIPCLIGYIISTYEFSMKLEDG